MLFAGRQAGIPEHSFDEELAGPDEKTPMADDVTQWAPDEHSLVSKEAVHKISRSSSTARSWIFPVIAVGTLAIICLAAGQSSIHLHGTPPFFQAWGAPWCAAPTGELPRLWPANNSGPQLRVKVMSYNLFWWNLFGIRRGMGGAAGHLIAAHNQDWEQHFDLFAFQECQAPGWVLGDAGLQLQYETRQGPLGLCMAVRKAAFQILDYGVWDVAEDVWFQHYGRRYVQYARLRHWETGTHIFFMNHHGPLNLGSGGLCGEYATAWRILQVAKEKAQYGDGIILAGDFNAQTWSATIGMLQSRLALVISGWRCSAADHIFTNTNGTNGADHVRTMNYGPGGSDHDAIGALVQFGSANATKTRNATKLQLQSNNFTELQSTPIASVETQIAHLQNTSIPDLENLMKNANVSHATDSVVIRALNSWSLKK